MKIPLFFSKHFLSLTTAFLMFFSISFTHAEVMGHIEDNKVDGQILSHNISPDGAFIYSATLSPASILVHNRNPETGELLSQIQLLSPPESEINFLPIEMAVSPDAKQLYIALNSDNILRYDISSSGELTYISSLPVDSAESLKISSDGKQIYIGGHGPTTTGLTVIDRSSNGNLSIKQELKEDKNGNDFSILGELILSPDNQQLYASSTSFDSRLYTFDINTDGTLTNTQVFMHKDNTYYPSDEDTKIEGAGGVGMAVSSDGKSLYTAGRFRNITDSISIFARSQDGYLTFYKNIISPPSSADNSNSIIFGSDIDLIESPNQKYLYAFDRIMKIISVWVRDSGTGELTFLDKITGIDNIHSQITMTSSSDGRHLYLNAEGGITSYDLRADLSLVKKGPSSNIAPNGTISYTLAATNYGASDAYNVVITDTLPEGTSFISGTVNSGSGGCSANGQTVSCTLGTLFKDDGYNAVIQVKAPATEGTVTNTASVSSDQLDTNSSNDSDSDTTTISTDSSSTSDGGGSLPLGILLLLPALLYRRASKFNH